MRLPLALALALAALPSLARSADYQIAVIPKGTTHEYWRSINAGAVKAQRELKAAGTDVQIIWKGPLLEDDREQQIQVVENFVGRESRQSSSRPWTAGRSSPRSRTPSGPGSP